MRKCPKCAEEIQLEAILCKHCKSDLEPIAEESDEEKESLFIAVTKAFSQAMGILILITIGFVVVIIVNSESESVGQKNAAEHEQAITSLKNKAKLSLKANEAKFSLKVNKGAFKDSQICKAAVSTIMLKPPSIIRSMASNDPSVTILSYTRQSDNTEWGYRCKLRGNLVIWASENGRWRTHPDDPKVTFVVKDDSITLSEQYSDSVNRRSFKHYEL